jgi:hypothetical protein
MSAKADDPIDLLMKLEPHLQEAPPEAKELFSRLVRCCGEQLNVIVKLRTQLHAQSSRACSGGAA